jgi:hypothetical protein
MNQRWRGVEAGVTPHLPRAAGVLAWAGNQTLAKKEAKKTKQFVFAGSFA